jgi:hypothetical protein
MSDTPSSLSFGERRSAGRDSITLCTEALQKSGHNPSPISRTLFASQEVGKAEEFIRWGPGAIFFVAFVRVSEETIG